MPLPHRTLICAIFKYSLLWIASLAMVRVLDKLQAPKAISDLGIVLAIIFSIAFYPIILPSTKKIIKRICLPVESTVI